MMERKLGCNVGSGQRRFTSTPEVLWINIDKISRPGHEPDLICDGAHIPRADGSVDYFVLHHVLEHFGCNDGVDLLAEAYRVLKPGGSLLVFVPDLRMLASRWLLGQLDTQLYMTNLYGAYMGDEADRHRWGYDRNSLHGFLRQMSWHGVEMFDWRHIPGADLACDWWIAGMECVR
jgi:predicted SAM-dependent methyltransferase